VEGGSIYTTRREVDRNELQFVVVALVFGQWEYFFNCVAILNRSWYIDLAITYNNLMSGIRY